MIFLFSSQSSNCLITHLWSVHGELEVKSIPLEVIVVLAINVTVNNRLADVKEEESWNHWEHNSSVVSRDTNVDNTISFEANPRAPPSEAAWFSGVGNLLFS